MANLIIEVQKQKPLLAQEGITLDEGKAMLKAAAEAWAKTKKGRKAIIDGLTLRCTWSDGKLAQLFEIDPCPAPKGEKKNQRGSK